MRVDELTTALHEAAARQPDVREALDAVLAGGKRRQRRRRAVSATALVLLLVGAGAAITAYSDAPGAVVLAGDGDPTGAVDGGVPCPNSVTRRKDGGRPGADGLPPLDSASVDIDRARAVMDGARSDLERAYDATRIGLGAGFGYAWVGESGGDYEVVEVDDYGILVGLPDITACPRDGGLHVKRDGVPLFFFVERSNRHDAQALDAVSIERIRIADGASGTEEVTIIFDGPLPGTEVSRVGSAVDVGDRLAFRVQSASAVGVCGATHFFGGADEPGAVDVLLPGRWIDPAEGLSPPLEYAGRAADAPGKVVTCGYGGVVQISIWGAAPDGDDPVEVRDVDGATQLVVHVRR